MVDCSISPEDKRYQVKVVGDDLIRHYGKKKFYSVEEVKESNRRNNIPVDVCCWSHATFNTHKDFDTYHHSIGEVCDYVQMKCEMIESISVSSGGNLFNFDVSWLEFPDIDLSIFDAIDL